MRASMDIETLPGPAARLPPGARTAHEAAGAGLPVKRQCSSKHVLASLLAGGAVHGS